ncbi:MAG TPA: hypothetical protein VK483_14765 [Chitinophagaceae bacterium]|nr:hypothetical protein [Chitinophagaceae bacterium]
MKSSRIQVIQLITGISFLIILTVVLVCSKTVFDLLDEGYYLLSYDREQPIYFQFTGFHFLVRLLPFSDDIFIVRLYRVLLLLLAAFVLARALHKKIFQQQEFLTVLTYVLLGNFSSYVFAPQTLSYNTLNLIFLELLIASYIFFRDEKLKSENYKQVILFSIVLGFLAFNKITTAVLMVSVVIIDQLIYKWGKWGQLIKTIFIVGFISLLVFVAVMFAAYGLDLPDKIKLLLTPGNPFKGRYLSYWFLLNQFSVRTFLQDKLWIIFTLAYLICYISFKKFKSENSPFLVALFALIAVSSCYYYRKIYYSFPGSEFFYSFLLFYFLIWLQSVLSQHETKKVDWHFIILFLLIPFIGFWGSDNPPFLGMNHYYVFGILLCLYFSQILPLKFFNIYPVIIAGYVVFNLLWQPFANPPVFEQKKSIIIHHQRINVSDRIYVANEAFEKILPAIQRENPLISVGTPIGLLYIHNLRNYFTIYFNHYTLTIGYLKLIQTKPLPDNSQILVCKTEVQDNEEINKALNDFMENIKKSKISIEKVAETDQYSLMKIHR